MARTIRRPQTAEAESEDTTQEAADEVEAMERFCNAWNLPAVASHTVPPTYQLSIFCRNLNGLPATDLATWTGGVPDLGADMVLVQEHHLGVSDIRGLKGWERRLLSDPQSRWVKGVRTSEGGWGGGVGSLVHGHWANRLTGKVQDPKGWGRFDGMVLSGKRGTRLVVINVYAPTQNGTVLTREKGIDMRTRAGARPARRGVIVDSMWEDLDKEMAKYYVKGAAFVLMGDFNALWHLSLGRRSGNFDAFDTQRHQRLRRLAIKYQLVNAYELVHGKPCPFTWHRGEPSDQPPQSRTNRAPQPSTTRATKPHESEQPPQDYQASTIDHCLVSIGIKEAVLDVRLDAGNPGASDHTALRLLLDMSKVLHMEEEPATGREETESRLPTLLKRLRGDEKTVNRYKDLTKEKWQDSKVRGEVLRLGSIEVK